MLIPSRRRTLLRIGGPLVRRSFGSGDYKTFYQSKKAAFAVDYYYHLLRLLLKLVPIVVVVTSNNNLTFLIDHTCSIFGAWVRVSELGKSIVHSSEPAVPFAWWPVAGLGPKPAAFTFPKSKCDIKGCQIETKTKKTS